VTLPGAFVNILTIDPARPVGLYPEGMTGGPVSNLGNTPEGKIHWVCQKKGNRFRRENAWLGRLAKAEQNSDAYAFSAKRTKV
jgi:hypothetical protein